MSIIKMIRKAYPGDYDDLSDAELERKVAKAPGAVRLKLARAEMDARAQSSVRDRGLDDPMSPEFQALRAEGEQKGTAEAAGPAVGMLGSALGLHALGMGAAGVAGAARGIPVVGKALQFATSRPGAAAIGAVEEGVRTGSPVEAVKGALLGAALGSTRGPVGRAVSVAEKVVPGAKAAPAVEAVAAETAAATKVLPKGSRAMATNLGGKAKPGPAATAPEDIEAALKASLDKIKNAPPLKGPRIEVGAQKVGRQVGMTKEEVRKATGPVLDEALGEASPILPKKALTSIIDTMKAIPVAEREAYVARATSGKAKWQVENIRRTLEHLGLLLPAGAVAVMEGQE